MKNLNLNLDVFQNDVTEKEQRWGSKAIEGSLSADKDVRYLNTNFITVSGSTEARVPTLYNDLSPMVNNATLVCERYVKEWSLLMRRK